MHKITTSWLAGLAIVFLTLQPVLSADVSDAQPRLHNDMGSGKLSGFKNTVEGQAQRHAGVFYLQSLLPEKAVALTFDDGPDPVYTRKILAILGQHHVKATFFLLGEKIKRYPDVVREIVQAGHAVGGHTYDHPDLRKLTLENAGSEIAKTQAQFRSAVGFEPDFFRPPFGAVTEDEIAHFGEMGFKLIDWSIDSFDWDLKHNSVAEILGKINAYKHPGAIVLMHAAGPHHQHTVDALPLIIADLEKDGYHFLTVPELLHIQAAFTDTQPRASNEPRQ